MRGQQGAPSAPALDHACPGNGMKSGAVSLIEIMLLFVEVEVLSFPFSILVIAG